ncbi:ribonucleoside triphosphate reductase [Candidatus Termititenax persephonae]|uniref:Ribonucleoside triphosphate reductase n=1 Tax=Candidatus Termititenax persephonae TaxID=2218525 RepID=A0A388TI77_9BACT|nr:ribonucleoside triphosphate reductase [Candidatus Termititenax persephonae]
MTVSTVKEIRKRNGHIVDFDRAKITSAIFKAAKAVGGHDKQLAETLTDKVIAQISQQFHVRSIPAVEEVQDIVEQVLIKDGYAKTAKAYILYREQRERKRDAQSTFVEVKNAVDEYMEKTDWRVFENSNSDFSFSGLMSHISGKIIANYALHEMYPKAIADAHRNGAIHIHDLSHAIVAYCCGWSLRQLIKRGFGGVRHKICSLPPRHLDVVVIQMVNFLGSLQMEHAGAQAFSSLDTLLAPFVKVDQLTYKQVKQQMQKFIFSLNVPSRWGCQPPFTNVTLDWVCPEDMRYEPAIVGGEPQDFAYGDCQKEMDMVNKAFMEVYLEGDAESRPFFYPIPTYNITKDFAWDTENANLLFKLTAKYGVPYFQNFVNSVLKPSDVRSMCCRLQLDLKELKNKTGGLFGAGEQTGSVGVVTINLPRLGFTSDNKEQFKEQLSTIMDLARDSLEIKRGVVETNLQKGLMPFTRAYLGSYDQHFSTIGINGMHEALQNLLGRGKGIDSAEGKALALEMLHFMRSKLKQYQEETGHLYNLEAAPCESATYRFALRDREQFPGIIQAGTADSPYYTNSTHLPVDSTTDIFEALDHQDELQVLYTGGTVVHGFIGESIEDAEVCKRLVKKISENYRLPYFTVTPTFSICPEHGYISGTHHKCCHVVEKNDESELVTA